ncbi:hypothetical protein RIF29_16767 [Crotalaria pallida]|uniref:Uncharacterized protein n=1 Tax=Crotalaria pallida TaxID=3830 RepID=A0AAN9IDX1_CROPI
MDANQGREEKSWCYFHTKQVVVGVCHLCLNERLLIVAAKQGHHHNIRIHNPFTSKASHRLQTFMHRKPSASIHKIFAFGSLFSRPESHQLKSADHNFENDASPSPEESFISIKFEENGVASWEKNSGVSNKVPLENSQVLNKDTKETKSMIQHGKLSNAFRWRKRIGPLFHVIHWRRSTTITKGGSKVEGVKVRKSWMRTLITKRKTNIE